MLIRAAAPLLILSTLMASPAGAQTDSNVVPRPIDAGGVFRASALVESVFVDHQLPRATVDAGDFTAYLMARLGVRDIPADFRYTVTVDSGLIRIGGRISELPAEARQALTQLVLLLPPDTRLAAEIELAPAGKEAVRFHLRAVTVQGVPIPETFLIPMMADIGRQYPALTSTGRDLYVQVPAGASMALVPGGVALTAP